MSYDKIDKDKEQKDKGGMRERDERVICRSGRQQTTTVTNKGHGRAGALSLSLKSSLNTSLNKLMCLKPCVCLLLVFVSLVFSFSSHRLLG